MNLREIHVTDAEAYLDLLKEIEHESPYSLLKPNERQTTVREQMDEITDILSRDNQTIFVVEDGPKLVAWLGAFGQSYERVHHSVIIGIGVRKGYRRQGWGTLLFMELEKWAKKQGIRRLELLVQSDNKPAISLYRKMGFQIEGTKRESYQIEGRYVDEYLMSRLLVEPEPPKRNPYPKW
jgi:RimJ/RimL family protein N-acetyltransferase